MEPAIVTGFVSLAVIGAIVVLRKYLGETDAAKKLAYAQAATEVMHQVVKAAQIAVVEVEDALKKHGELSDEMLKEEAVDIVVKLLESWGVVVSPAFLQQIAAVVEWAYQEMKSMRRVEDAYYTTPVLVEN